MVDGVATALKRLKRRSHHSGPKDPVFVNEDGEAMDGSALRRR